MINFDAVDFSERRPEEVISFFWRSVYYQMMYTYNTCLYAKIDDHISEIIVSKDVGKYVSNHVSR